MASQAPATTRVCLRQLSRPTWKSGRQFSTSASRRRKGPVSVFPRTSNEELNDVLADLRNTVFMPNHLNADQRRLVYRQKWQHYLTGEEPVRIELDVTATGTKKLEYKEAFTLQPLDQTKEPRHAQTFNQVVDLLASTPDARWDLILPQFLRELHTVGRKVTRGQAQRLIRRAADSNQLSVVIECLRRVGNMGFRIGHSDVSRALLLAAHQRAGNVGFGLTEDGTVAGDTARAEFDKAVTNARNTISFTEDPRHVTHGAPGDPRQAPELYGAAMALVAVRRLLFVSENTPEKTAARQAAVEMPHVELPEGTEEAIENSSGETPAEEAEQAAEAEGETAAAAETSPEVVFALGEHDLPIIEELATQMLDLSESANLGFDASKPHEVREMLSAWLPVWFGIQVAGKALAQDSPVLARLRAAFDAEIGPQVERALAASEQFSASGDGRSGLEQIAKLVGQQKTFLAQISR